MRGAKSIGAMIRPHRTGLHTMAAQSLQRLLGAHGVVQREYHDVGFHRRDARHISQVAQPCELSEKSRPGAGNGLGGDDMPAKGSPLSLDTGRYAVAASAVMPRTS